MEEKRDIFDRIMDWPVFAVFRPFYRRYKEALLYLFFGGLTTLVSIGSYGASLWGGMEALTANVLSWILAVSFAYVTNSIWVFDARPSGIKERISQIAGFFGGRVFTLAVEEAVLLIFVKWMGLSAMAVKIFAQFLVLVLNYVISKLVVFRKDKS